MVRLCYAGRVKIFLLLLLSLPLLAQSPVTLHQTIQIDRANYQAYHHQKPDTPGKHPAVFLIGGLGCFSLDDLKPDDPFFQLFSGLTQRGYVTMRVDKNGEGKSEGPPCDSPQSDLQLAVKRSFAGLDALAALDSVDRDKIFILAHSIGPLEGVLVAQKFPGADSSPLKPSVVVGSNMSWKMSAGSFPFLATRTMKLIAPSAPWNAASTASLLKSKRRRRS